MKRIIMVFYTVLFSLTFSTEFKVGDEIKLKISNINEENAKQIFKEQSIEKISKEKDGIKIIFRDWTKGLKNFEINNQNLPIKIESNILPEEKEIFLDYNKGSILEKTMEKKPYQAIIGIILLIFGIILWILSLKKEKIRTPEKIYQEKINNLTENYYFEASYCLREYIDAVYKTNFLNGSYREIGILNTEDIEFIKKLDYQKFSDFDNQTCNEDEKIVGNKKEELKDKVEEIVNKIKKSKLENEVKKNV